MGKSKFLKKVALISLAAVTAFGAVACGNDSGKTTVTNDPPASTVTESEQHLVANGLHEVSVTDVGRSFIEDGKTEYKIIYGASESAKRAAQFMQKHIIECTGADITIKQATDETAYEQNSKIIAVDVPSLFTAAGLTMPDRDLGVNGYYIKNAGNSYFIAVGEESGAQSGAIAFLRHFIGYEMYADDTIVYDKDGKTVPDMEITEKPDFDFRVQGNAVSSEAIYGMGFQLTSSLFISVEGERWHNSLNFLPESEYAGKHPDWYTVAGGEICYNARGNTTEYNALVDTVYELIMAYADDNPTIPNICFTVEDNPVPCTCAACEQTRKDYNGSNAAAVIKFTNAVNRKVQAALLERAGGVEANKRLLNILFFAYRSMEAPPVKKNASGVWVPIDETVVCDDNVGVYLAPINAAYNQSFYHTSNSAVCDSVDGWSVLSKKLYMWLYETNYSHYLYPLNTYDTMLETYRFCKSHNAVYMMNEGQYNQGNVTHFGKFKEYFNARAEFNVNDNFADIADDFFAAYFREAATPMREYFDRLQIHLRDLEQLYPADVNGNIYNEMAQSRFWPYATLRGWLDLIDDAYKAIEPYKDSDPDLYATLKKHIKLESIFPRFALIRLHAGMYTKSELNAMRKEFKNDCNDLNIRYESESSSLDSLFSEWGV